VARKHGVKRAHIVRAAERQRDFRIRRRKRRQEQNYNLNQYFSHALSSVSNIWTDTGGFWFKVWKYPT